jgi:hypothetical protein
VLEGDRGVERVAGSPQAVSALTAEEKRANKTGVEKRRPAFAGRRRF